MPQPRRSAPRPTQLWLLVLAIASAVVLLLGVATTLVTGVASLWPMGAAIVLAASLMLLRSLRRSGQATTPASPSTRSGASRATSTRVFGETQPGGARRP